MHDIINFLEFIIAAIVVLVALALILLVIVSRMPADNPLRQILNMLIARIGVTAAAGALAIPIEPVPGLDVLYDIGAPLLLLYYWYRFFKKIAPIWSGSPPRRDTSR